METRMGPRSWSGPPELVAAKALKNTEEPLASAELNARMAVEYLNRGDIGSARLYLAMCIAILASMAEGEQE